MLELAVINARFDSHGVGFDVEFEYPVPKDSDVMTELAKCVQFCKNALV